MSLNVLINGKVIKLATNCSNLIVSEQGAAWMITLFSFPFSFRFQLGRFYRSKTLAGFSLASIAIEKNPFAGKDCFRSNSIERLIWALIINCFIQAGSRNGIYGSGYWAIVQSVHLSRLARSVHSKQLRRRSSKLTGYLNIDSHPLPLPLPLPSLLRQFMGNGEVANYQLPWGSFSSITWSWLTVFTAKQISLTFWLLSPMLSLPMCILKKLFVFIIIESKYWMGLYYRCSNIMHQFSYLVLSCKC